MKKVWFDKLVRDNVSSLLEQKGAKVFQKILTDQEYEAFLKEKLVEEGHELVQAKTKQEITEELADVYEVLGALADFYSIDAQEILQEKDKKRVVKGGFEKRIFIESIEYENNLLFDQRFKNYKHEER